MFMSFLAVSDRVINRALRMLAGIWTQERATARATSESDRSKELEDYVKPSGYRVGQHSRSILTCDATSA